MADGPVQRCGSCGCPELAPVLDLGEQPLPQARRIWDTIKSLPYATADKRYPLRLVECTRCTLVQLDYIVPQRELFPADYPYATGNTKALREHFAEQARTIAAMIAPGDLVIDIGGNDGTMLLELRELLDTDVRLLLIEPTDQARKAIGAGIDTVQEYFTAGLAMKIRQSHGAAAVIVTSNTFGHVPDPHVFLSGVTALLADDGTFIVDNQDWLNVVNGLQIDTIYHEHLRYYSPASLSYLLAKHDLLVTSLTRLAMHGGSFRAVIHRQKPDLPGRAKALAFSLHMLLEDAACDGPVYAIGAPTRATPLVHFADIGRYLTCACEIAGSEKIGACIPGTSIAVVDEAKLIIDQPPHALLLAWDLADSIVPKLRQRGYKGRIIVPLPEPGVLDG